MPPWVQYILNENLNIRKKTEMIKFFNYGGDNEFDEYYDPEKNKEADKAPY